MDSLEFLEKGEEGEEGEEEQEPLATAAAPTQGGRSDNPLGRMRCCNLTREILLDSMHTIAGVIRGLLIQLQDLRDPNGNALKHELEINRRDFSSNVHLAGKVEEGPMFLMGGKGGKGRKEGRNGKEGRHSAFVDVRGSNSTIGRVEDTTVEKPFFQFNPSKCRCHPIEEHQRGLNKNIKDLACQPGGGPVCSPHQPRGKQPRLITSSSWLVRVEEMYMSTLHALYFFCLSFDGRFDGSDVIPWLCWEEEIKGGRRDEMAIIARHWGILRPLGLPTVPATHPLPAVLKTTNV